MPGGLKLGFAMHLVVVVVIVLIPALNSQEIKK